MSELSRVFQSLEFRKVQSETSHEDKIIDRHYAFFVEMQNSKHCKKCKSCYLKQREQDEASGVNWSPVRFAPHHPDVVKSDDQSGSAKTRRCKYVVTREWADFLVAEKHLLDYHPSFRAQTKRLLLAFHFALDAPFPPVQWHYTMLFPFDEPISLLTPAFLFEQESAAQSDPREHEKTEKVATESEKVESREEDIYIESKCDELDHLELELMDIDNDEEELQRHIDLINDMTRFLEDFRGFYLGEFGLPSDDESYGNNMTMSMVLGSNDLFMDSLAYTNLSRFFLDRYGVIMSDEDLQGCTLQQLYETVH